MEITLEPQKSNIEINPMSNDKYEINFSEEIWLYLDKEQIKELRDKINDVLIEKDIKLDMLREKQDYIDEVKRAGGKVE